MPGHAEQAGLVDRAGPRSRRRSMPRLCSRYSITPGIEAAAARAHRQPVERGEAHGGVDAAAVVHRAEAGAVAEMGDDHAAAGQIAARCWPACRRCIRRTGRGSRSAGCPASCRSRGRAKAGGDRRGRDGRRCRSRRPAAGSGAACANGADRRAGCAAGAAAPAASAPRSVGQHGVVDRARARRNAVPPCTTRWPTADQVRAGRDAASIQSSSRANSASW